jgi:endonuclease/exonuclease/phosphatase (EEP) superfamily protein YafD
VTARAHRSAARPTGFAKAVLVLTLLGTAFVTMALWMLTDRWWTAVPLGYGPRWPWLALALLPLAAFGARWRTRVGVSLAVAATIAVSVMGFRWSLVGDPGPGGGLKVVAFNAATKSAAVSDMLLYAARNDADILATVECPRMQQHPQVPGYSLSLAGEICLWTRNPIVGRIEVMQRDAARVGWSGTVARFDIEHAGDTLAVGIVHLRSVRNELKEFLDISEVAGQADSMELRHAKRITGSSEASAWLRTGDRPAEIVIGDFNLVVEGTAWRRDWHHWTDAWESRGRGFGYTWGSSWSWLRIDHVIHDSRWRTRRISVGPRTGSDHRAVMVELDRR